MLKIHGCYEDPGEFVAIIDSHIDGDWDSPTTLNSDHFQKATPEWDEKLKKFCELMGIDYQEPRWLMVCNYG
jgi:hypothetical protein